MRGLICVERVLQDVVVLDVARGKGGRVVEVGAATEDAVVAGDISNADVIRIRIARPDVVIRIEGDHVVLDGVVAGGPSNVAGVVVVIAVAGEPHPVAVSVDDVVGDVAVLGVRPELNAAVGVVVDQVVGDSGAVGVRGVDPVLERRVACPRRRWRCLGAYRGAKSRRSRQKSLGSAVFAAGVTPRR
jgi:hypothetical protein